VTLVDVIGEYHADYAVNVYFDELGKDYWFAPELLEFIDHAPGTEILVSGSNKKLVRTRDGRWREEPLSTKPWWKFWG